MTTAFLMDAWRQGGIHGGWSGQEEGVPKYIDHHGKTVGSRTTLEMISQAQQMLQQLRADIAARRADRFGVTPINCYQAPSGEWWCVTEAPDADAVIKSHEAHGLKLTRHDIVQITPIV